MNTKVIIMDNDDMFITRDDIDFRKIGNDWIHIKDLQGRTSTSTSPGSPISR